MEVADDVNVDEALPPYATPNPHPSRGVYGEVFDYGTYLSAGNNAAKTC